MTRLTLYIIMAGISLVLLIGCRKDDNPAPNTGENNSNNAPIGADADSNVLRDSAIDANVPAVGVERLMRNQSDYSGRLAVEGAVVKCFEGRGAFVMVDVEEFKSCGLDACTDAAMPVRIERDQYEGVFPQPGQQVTLVGEFEPLERGFRFDLHEVHRGGSVILARRQGE